MPHLTRASTSLLLITWLALSPCAAQDATPNGWSRQQRPNGVTVYSHPSKNAVIVKTEASLSTDVGQLAEGVRRTSQSSCPALRGARAASVLDGRARQLRSTLNGRVCSIVYGTATSAQLVLFSAEQVTSGLNAEGASLTILAARMESVPANASGAPLSTPPRTSPPIAPPTVAQTPIATARTPGDETALRNALAKVPRANRPSFFVDRWSNEMIGTNLIRANHLWMAFENGYATNCVGWNPATTAPIPATLEARVGCNIARWQKRADGSYRILDADGEKEDPITPSQWRAFSSGQRLDVNFDNWNARGGATGGVMPYTDITIRELVMRRDGTFGSAEQNESWWRGEHREQSAGVTGRYLVDGYLIAVQQPDGIVTLHFGCYQLVNGTLRLIAFDGRQYTPK